MPHHPSGTATPSASPTANPTALPTATPSAVPTASPTAGIRDNRKTDHRPNCYCRRVCWFHTNLARIRRYPIPYTLYPKPYTLYPILYTLYPVPYTLYPIPNTLYPILYTLYSIPYTLYPIPYTLYCPCLDYPCADLPQSSEVGSGLCIPLGVRVYNGNGDNEGTTQERTARCAAACFNKKTALEYGPWSTRADAVGYGVDTNGRCYCQHDSWASCTKDFTQYTAYEFAQPGMHLHTPSVRAPTLLVGND